MHAIFVRARGHEFWQKMLTDWRAVEGVSHVCMLPAIGGLRLTVAELTRVPHRLQQQYLIEPDLKIRLNDQSSANMPQLQWGLKALRVEHAWKYSVGAGTRVAVIDTGVDATHPDLRRSVHGGVDLLASTGEHQSGGGDELGMENGSTAADQNGHGTHIAATIAGSGMTGLLGVAPAASLYSVKAFDHHGAAYISDIVRAIEWCIRKRMDIINMSFGMPANSPALHEAILRAARKGILLVASAGNGGLPDAVDFPARYPSVLSVGAVNRRGEVAAFSKRGADVEVYAPGTQILSAWPGGGYKHLDGSSMATAHISGLIALLTGVKRDIRMSEIRAMLATTGKIKRMDAWTSIRTLLPLYDQRL